VPKRKARRAAAACAALAAVLLLGGCLGGGSSSADGGCPGVRSLDGQPVTHCPHDVTVNGGGGDGRYHPLRG
jgi:hypothetical protein